VIESTTSSHRERLALKAMIATMPPSTQINGSIWKMVVSAIRM